MGLFIKFVLMGLLGGLSFWLYQQAGIENSKGLEASNDVMVVYWGSLILCSVGFAILFAFTFLPRLGEMMAGFFYSAPSEAIEKGPHSEALAKIAAGDYPAAIEAYEKAIVKDPDDVFALVEISKLFIDRLGDPNSAAARLEAALQHDWPKDKVGPVMFRLADVYWKGLDDGDRARMLLEQILEMLPGSTHAANAGARLREIEQTEREREEASFLSGNSPQAAFEDPVEAAFDATPGETIPASESYEVAETEPFIPDEIPPGAQEPDETAEPTKV